MEPIRILQVVTIMNRGGLETMLMNYYRQINRESIQFDFMVHREEKGHYDNEIEELGGNIYRMPPIKPGNYRLYFKLLNEFFTHHLEYKVVHSHINENSSFVLRAAKKAGVPCRIAHSHLSDLGLDFKLPFRIYARSNMKDNPNQYFACSKNAAEWLFGHKIAQSNKIVVLQNAVNASKLKFNQEIREKVRKELGVENRLVIGHIGRFNKQKNHEYLLEIFKSVNQQEPNSILILVGDGELRGKIEKKARKLGLLPNILFLGIRGDISELLQAMDLFLFPSLFEGLPVVLIEAQASGLRCVVSDSITQECNITGRVEYLSLKDSPLEWSNKILSLTHDHEDTHNLIRKNGFDTSITSEWLTNYYENYYRS